MSRTPCKNQAARLASTLITCAASVAATFSVAAPVRADLLVVAPHPDDDVITAAGVIYRARLANTAVWVAYMTNGDFYPQAGWGRTRADEAVTGQALLNVPADHLLFLGYPDGSLQNLYGPNRSVTFVPQNDPQGATDPSIRANRANQSSTTYTRTGSQSYGQIRTGAPVNATGDNVNADLVHILTNRTISDIFVLAPTDMHPDHSSTSRFVIDAVVNASRAATTTLHFSYVWDQTGINPYVWPLAPNATTYFTQPPALAGKDDSYQINFDWASRESLDVPLALQTEFAPTLQNLKARAINAHTTQGGFTGLRDQGHISSFVHKDEFFYSRRVVVSGTDRFASTRVPVPNAGLDQTVAATTTATLDGAGSLVYNARTLTFAWRQAEGPAVTLAGATTARASFTVPDIAQGTALTFELRVSDGVSTSVADAVTVRVGAPPPPDAGVDAGSDAGVDAGSDASIDSDGGSDAGIFDASEDASATLDAGSDTGADIALPDSAAELDTGTEDAGAETDAAVSELDAGDDVSAWPGDGLEQDTDEVIEGDAGSELKKKGDSGCALAAEGTDESRYSGLLLLALGALWRRRRVRDS